MSQCLAGRAYPFGEVSKENKKKVKHDAYSILTALHSKRAAEDEPVYPYLRTLLKFDSRGLLNVISMAFEEPEFNNDHGRFQKQRLVDILIQIVDGHEGPLFTFLSRHVKSIIISKDTLEKFLENSDKLNEQALLDMIQSGGLEHFDRESLIAIADKVNFYRTLEYLHEQSGDYHLVLKTYLDDPDENRRGEVFQFVEKVEIHKVEKSVIKEVYPLMKINPQKMSNVILNHMYNYIPLVRVKLEDDKSLLYLFTKCCFEFKDSGSQPATPVKNHAGDPMASAEMFESYIEMMCIFESGRVAKFLRHTTLNFDSEKILRLCQKAGNFDGQIFIYERSGRFGEAFDLLKDKPEEHVDKLIEICQSSKKQDLWFRLLEILLEKGLKREIHSVINSAIGHVPLRLVIEKVLKDPLYSEGNFGDVKGFLIEIMQIYHYEKTTLESTVQLVRSDLRAQINRKMFESNKGIAVSGDINCQLCDKHLAVNGGQCLVFVCGHRFHPVCLANAGGYFLTEIGEEKWQCYSCVANRTGRLSGSSATKAQLSPQKNALTERQMSEITDPGLTAAKEFSDRFKSQKSPLAVYEDLSKPKNDDNDDTALDVRLQLWPDHD